MIKLLKQGSYQLIQTKGETRLLVLNNNYYAWIIADRIGDILVISKNKPQRLYQIARGNYRLYDVADEPKLADTHHLELYTGEGLWQGYLLPTGLPKAKDLRNRIIPTKEIITQTSN